MNRKIVRTSYTTPLPHILLLLIIRFCTTPSVYAEPNEELVGYLEVADGMQISELEVIPGKRTKKQYIIDLIDIEAQERYTMHLHREIYLRLWKSGLFFEIHINPIIDYSQAEPALILQVTVVDKWTLIPVPLLSFDSQNFSAGLAIVEQNLFGYGNTLVFSGLYGSNRFFFNILFRYTKIRRSNVSLSALNYIGISQYEDYSHGYSNTYNTSNSNVNTLIRKSQGLVAISRLRIKYDITQELSAYSSLEYRMFNNEFVFDNSYETINSMPSSWHLPLTVGLSYESLLPSGILSKGLSAGIGYTLSTISSEIEYYHAITTKAFYNLELGKAQRQILAFRIDAELGNLPLFLSQNLGGDDTTRSISSNSIRTNKFTSAAVEHIITVWQRKEGGIFTSYGGNASIYELTEYRQAEFPVLNGGVYITAGFALNQIAIPLVTVVLGYNIPAQYMTYSIAIGAR